MMLKTKITADRRAASAAACTTYRIASLRTVCMARCRRSLRLCSSTVSVGSPSGQTRSSADTLRTLAPL
ncbi:hypothetical protein NQZ68_037106 [Dissostichus eleginoides]|nr:hypothetical protein NQZ68_037106 [Dissostichus eleginoides]